MQAKYLRSLFFLLFLNLIIKPVWLLGIDRGVQRMAGIDSYGLYYFIISISFYLQMVLDPGLNTHNNKTLAQDPGKLSSNLAEFLPLKLLLSALYIIATLAIGIVMLYFNQNSATNGSAGNFDFVSFSLLWWVVFNQVLASFILYMRSCLSGIYLFNTDSIFSVLDRTIMIFIVGAMLWGHFMPVPFRIEWFVYAQTVSYCITALAITVVVLSKTTLKIKRPKIRWTEYSDILIRSYPFAVLAFLMVLYSQIDRTMVYKMVSDGEHEVGLYAMAYRILDAFNQVAFLFATILLPVFTGHIHRKESLNGTVRVFARLLLIPGLLLVLSSYFYKGEIMNLLYKGQTTDYLSDIFGYLMISFLALGAVYIYGTLLTANGNIRFLNITAGAGLIVNIAINLILIPIYGVLGAVIATLATQFAVSMLQFWKAHQLFRLNNSAIEMIKVIVWIMIAISSFVFLRGYISNWIFSIAALTALNLTFAFIIGLFDFKFFINILKYKA
jgi:O-antigen/teichoic acid export membrane protein